MSVRARARGCVLVCAYVQAQRLPAMRARSRSCACTHVHTEVPEQVTVVEGDVEHVRVVEQCEEQQHADEGARDKR